MGNPRKLFAVQQRASGDLTLVIKQGLHATEYGTYRVPNTAAAKIKEQRISIHRSVNSPANINAIKATTVRADGKITIFRHYTKAIRCRHAFAPLYLKRCSDLSDPHYLVGGEVDSRLSLGAYNPKRFQLIYKVFVGSALSEFRIYCKHDINLIQIVLGDFRVVLMWCFVSGPSTTTSHILGFQTLSPAELGALPSIERSVIEAVADGCDEEECVFVFRDLRESAMRIFFQNMINDTPGADRIDISSIESFAAFFRHPNLKTREFIDHFRRFELFSALLNTSK